MIAAKLLIDGYWLAIVMAGFKGKRFRKTLAYKSQKARRKRSKNQGLKEEKRRRLPLSL
jgi:hypothetical protein